MRIFLRQIFRRRRRRRTRREGVTRRREGVLMGIVLRCGD